MKNEGITTITVKAAFLESTLLSSSLLN